MEDFDIQDDMHVDPETYKDRKTGPIPPAPGNYVVKATNYGYKKDKAGNIVKWRDTNGDPTYPVIRINTVEITDPFEFGRKVTVFQDVPSYPMKREDTLVSQTADLLRAIDATVATGNTGETLKALTERLDGGLEFKARLDYVGYDGKYAAKLIAEAGGKDALDKKALNKLYDQAKVKGYRNIQKDNAKRGKATLPAHMWAGPSGDVLEVSPTLTVFYPATETPRLGPDQTFVKA